MIRQIVQTRVTSLTLCSIPRNYRCQYLVFGILSRRRPLRAETRPFLALGQNSILNVKQMSNILWEEEVFIAHLNKIDFE